MLTKSLLFLNEVIKRFSLDFQEIVHTSEFVLKSPINLVRFLQLESVIGSLASPQ